MSNYYDGYAQIKHFGQNAGGQLAIDNPLSYVMGNTLGQNFLHTTSGWTQGGQFSNAGQYFLANYGAANFDEFCCYTSQNTYNQVVGVLDNDCRVGPNIYFPSPYNVLGSNLTAGELVIRQAAMYRYLGYMINGVQHYEPFDYLVADSPIIMIWKVKSCPPLNYDGHSVIFNMIPIYYLNEKMINEIDNDSLMSKIINKPYLGSEILIGIYMYLLNKKDGGKLMKKLMDSNTSLGNFYKAHSLYFEKSAKDNEKWNWIYDYVENHNLI